jgi:hypothetical protein
MDINKIFSRISDQFVLDFEITAEITHPGSKGTARENKLKIFLKDKLPEKYGLGNGEIVSPSNDVTKQCDLIVFNKMDGIPLFQDLQIYPLESVLGVVEVKSNLTKVKLEEGLNAIKSVKEIVPKDTLTFNFIEREYVGGYTQSFQRPVPFGIIFAFDLEGNSLDSLLNNLYDWEKDVDSRFWPNLIVVLNQGIIYHTNADGKECFIEQDIVNKNVRPSYVKYEEDTLINFYSMLLILCRNLPTVSFELSPYLNLPFKIGDFFVQNYRYANLENEDLDNKELNKSFTFSEEFIAAVVRHGESVGKQTLQEILSKQYGKIPDDYKNSTSEFFLYNPDNLPGSHEVEDNSRPNIGGSAQIRIDDDMYVIPEYYIEKENLESVSSKKFTYEKGSIPIEHQQK